MRASKVYLALTVAAALAGAQGCFITTDEFKASCKTKSDCPKAGKYVCAGPDWPQRDCAENEANCACEVKFPPDPDGGMSSGSGGGTGTASGGGSGASGGGTGASGGGTGGAGGGMVIDSGPPPPEYCGDAGARRVLQKFCVFTCHSTTQMGYPNSPPDFRLDYYPSYTAPDGNFLAGVADKVARIKSRTADKSMPPTDFLVQFGAMPQADRDLVVAWVNAGALAPDLTCEDAGAKPPADAGSDAGVDAGVLFATQVVPIFQQRCSPCHTTNMSGGLSLTAANAYNSLVGPNATCNGAVKRVTPNNTTGSMLWRKLVADAGFCGNSMPNGQTPLFMSQPAQFKTIETWIVEGAKNN